MLERVTNSVEIHDLLIDIVQRARASLVFDSGGLMLYNATTQTLVPQVYMGEASHPAPVALGESVIGQVARAQQAELVGDMLNDERCLFFDPASRAQLAVPMTLNGELLGVFNVESHHPHIYTNNHLALLQALADQAALVIYATRLHQDVLDRHSRLQAEALIRRRETDTMQRLATITSSTLDLDHMLAEALRETAELVDCEGAQVFMPDYAGYQLVVHEPSLYGITQGWPRASWPLDGPGYLVDVFHTGKAFASDTPPPDYAHVCRNVLACPLNTRSRTLGVLHLVNCRQGAFQPDQIEVAQLIANQIAVSLGSAQTFADERRRAEMTAQINRVSQELYATLDPKVLLSKTAQNIYEVFGPDAVYIMLLGDDNQTVRVQASAIRSTALQPPRAFTMTMSQGVIGRTIVTGQTQLVPDVRYDPDFLPQDDHHRVQSCLVVPLRQGEQVIGAIDLASTELNAFSNLERDAMETLATQVSIALENARLYDEAQRRLADQGMVYQVGQALVAILDYGDLVQTMARYMATALGASGCLVGLFDPQQDTVRVEAEYRVPQHPRANAQLLTGQHLPLKTFSTLNEAVHTRRPTVVYADDPDTAPGARGRLDQLGDHAQLSVPMVAGDRVIGLVDWTDQQPGRVFSRDDIRLAQTLVSQATIAIDNALLFQQLETRARELAEANRLKSQFLATISHELRTPMNSIIGFSNALLNNLYGDLNEQQSSRLERILHNGQHLLMLIDDLLDLSRIDSGRMELIPENVSVRETAAAVVRSMEAQAADKGLSIHLAIPANLPPVYADSQRLSQVIANLLSNAIKFTRQGTITITSRQTGQPDQPLIETTVADTGIGISKADQAVIFDEFRQADGSTTRQYGGTGLGLAIIKKLVEMMGGSIWVESEPGQGSRFTFVLPVGGPRLLRTVSRPPGMSGEESGG